MKKYSTISGMKIRHLSNLISATAIMLVLVLPCESSCQHSDTVLFDTSYFRGRFLKDFRHYQKFYELKTSQTVSLLRQSKSETAVQIANTSILAIQVSKGSQAGKGALIGMLCGFGATLWLVAGTLASNPSSPDYDKSAAVLAATGVSFSTAAAFAAIGAAIGSAKKKYKTVYLDPRFTK